MDRYLIAIGGGSLAEKETKDIDGYCAELAKKHAGDKRAIGVFIGTASHDSMPYFNSFRKTYTSIFDIKADCVLSVYGEMNYEKIKSKFEKADMLYIGGGDTLYMLERWKETGVYELVLDAYMRGVPVAGISAGAIFWFNKMYTDSEKYIGGEEYCVKDGIAKIDGICCPHYEVRQPDFDPKFPLCGEKTGWLIEGNSALVFKNETYVEALTSGGNAYNAELSSSGEIIKNKLI